MTRLIQSRRRLARVPVIAQDTVFATALCVLDLRTQWSSQATDRWIGDGPLPWQLVATFGAAGYAALIWRRRNPELVFVLLFVHNVIAQLLLPYRPFLGLLVAFYTVTSRTTLSRSLYALLAVTVVSALTVADEVKDTPAASRDNTLVVDTILFGLLELTVWAIGRWIRRSRHDLTDLEQRRQNAGRLAVAEERSRIARELHDIVAHSVTIMVLQAAGARRILSDKSPQVKQALADIEATGRQAMGELRRLLGVLASADIQAGGELDELQPHPGLNDIPPVLARVAAAGLPVQMHQQGTPQRLDTSVGLAAHRVVTEGLTNTLKHSGAGARTTVHLDWTPAWLTISVTDDGRGHQQTDAHTLSTGRGLIGLGERVRAVGGVLDAGPLPAGGFRVSATLPTADQQTDMVDRHGDPRIRPSTPWPDPEHNT